MRSIILFAICLVWLWFAGNSWTIGETSIPPLGKFLSPSEGFWWNALSVDDPLPDELKFDGVEGEVVLDERKVPHIFCSSDHDAYFIQGYMHAMHRLWQMDFSAMAAEGRISEIIGPKAIEFDRNKRRKGLFQAARMNVEHWEKDSFLLSRIQAYVNGVNAYIHSISPKQWPVEYKLLNHRPEPWSLYRTALFHKSMAEILCGRDKDIEMTHSKIFFKHDFNFLFPEVDSLTDPVIPKGTPWPRAEFSKEEVLQDTAGIGFFPFTTETGVSGLGSNNWAVHPSKTKNGHAILCNDPHLSLTLPSIWYEQQIHTPEYSVYGVGFPGVPGIVIGFNEQIAWGVTNAGWDVLDWYKIEWQDATMKKYKLDGQWVDTNVRLDTILVKGRQAVVDSVRMTHWGPVVYTDTAHRKFGLAMHWILHEAYEQQEFRAFLTLNRAKNYEDYRFACTQFPYPAQNFAYASRTGDIALTVSGNMPLKKNQEGRFVRDGSDRNNGWHGWLDPMLNPAHKNPARGFVSSANQRSTDVDFPVYFNDGDFRSYRGAMVNTFLSKQNEWDVDAMKNLQYNSFSLKAATCLPFLMHSVDSNKRATSGKLVWETLSQWNHYYDSASVAPVYFELWFDRFYRMVWDELKTNGSISYALPNEWSTMELADSIPDHIYFDYQATNVKETSRQIAAMAFDSVLQYIEKHPELKDWAHYKNAEIVHLTRIPAFGRYGIRTSGNEDIINAHAKTFGPSWRMIVELGKDSIVAYGIYPGGQSGAPGSSYYDHMVEPWSKGQYNRLHFWSSPPASVPFMQKIIFKP